MEKVNRWRKMKQRETRTGKELILALQLHPYIPFPLYLSARIFAQMAKANPQDDNANSLVRFLLSALVAMKDVNPLVDSYLAQLDMEDLGLSALQENVRMFGLERSVVSPVFFCHTLSFHRQIFHLHMVASRA